MGWRLTGQGLTAQTRAMTGDQRRIVYFMLHVPKCAGSTILGHMDAHLGPRSMQAPLWKSSLRNFIGNRYPFKPGDREVTEVDVFHGHALSQSLAAHFPGADIPYKQLKTTLKGEVVEEAWASLKRTVSRPFARPSSGRVAVKVINHLGDEVMKVLSL